MPNRSSSDTSCAANNRFPITQWTAIWAARNGDPAEALAALNNLCHAYWRPLFYYVRRSGHGFEEARDLTQAFFTHLLEMGQLRHLTHQDGKFRSFLLTLLNHFLSDARDHARALKRGGGQVPIFLDALTEEERYQVEPANGVCPEHFFDRCWAKAVLDRAQQRLQEEYALAGKGALLVALQQHRPGRSPAKPSYAELAVRLSLSESAVTSSVYRLRRRHAEILREEVGRTVADRADTDDEIRYLMEVVGR